MGNNANKQQRQRPIQRQNGIIPSAVATSNSYDWATSNGYGYVTTGSGRAQPATPQQAPPPQTPTPRAPTNHIIPNSNYYSTSTTNRNTLEKWEFVNANYAAPKSSTVARHQVASSPVFSARGSQVRHEQIRITNDAIGFGYEKIFGGILDSRITLVIVDDPYIRISHQIYNFLRFCELLVKSCKNLKEIYLTTTSEPNVDKQKQQTKNLMDLRNSLQQNGIVLTVEFSNTLHDREITFDNGCIVKIGRGLDYFKKTENFAIGFCDFNLRKCLPTTVDIFRH